MCGTIHLFVLPIVKFSIACVADRTMNGGASFLSWKSRCLSFILQRRESGQRTDVSEKKRCMGEREGDSKSLAAPSVRPSSSFLGYLDIPEAHREALSSFLCPHSHSFSPPHSSSLKDQKERGKGGEKPTSLEASSSFSPLVMNKF